MHVLYFHQHFSTPRGATGLRSYAMARALLARGHSVTMVCGSYQTGRSGLEGPFRRGVRSGTVDGIGVVEFALPYANRDSFLRRSLTFLRYSWRSMGAALLRKSDLVFATSTPLTSGIPGIAARWLRGKRFVFEVRDLWPELPREMGVITNPAVLTGMDWLEWLSYHSAAGCVGLSPGIVRGIARRGIAEDRIAMVPNGCDLDLFAPESCEPLDLPGVDPGDLVAVFTGTHGIANGLDRVLDAAAVLRARGETHIRLVFVGEGKQKPELVARAEAENLDNCLFLDPMPKADLARLLARADVGLMILANVPAFYYGTSPNKFFDYIAAARPVLCNYPGWLAEMIGENACGIAVPPEDAEGFADALQRLAADPSEREAMGRRARQLAEERFDRAALAEQWCDFLERMHAS